MPRGFPGEYEELKAEIRRLTDVVATQDAELDALRHSRALRYSALLRRASNGVRQLPPRRVGSTDLAESPPEPERQPRSEDNETTDYARWIEEFDTIDDDVRGALRSRLATLGESPLVSVLLSVTQAHQGSQGHEDFLSGAIESVVGQIYPRWELCISVDLSTEAHVAQMISKYATEEPRIKITTTSDADGVAAAYNAAVDRATGEWITSLGPEDLMSEHALALAMLTGADSRDAAVIYSDEDRVDELGRRSDPHFKTDFDPLLLLGQNYLSHLLLIRRHLVRAAGGYRLHYEGSEDFDLILRITEDLEPSRIVHIPHVLYHRRIHDRAHTTHVPDEPGVVHRAVRVVAEHLDRTGLTGQVTRISALGYNRVTWALPDPAPSVTIIIPTRDGPLLSRCIDSLLSLTTYPNFGIVVIDNGSRKRATLNYLERHRSQLTVVNDSRPFNYSALNNAAVEHTSSPVLCLLNDDTEVINGDWLQEMVSQLLVPGVGAVGAKLFYPDGRVQHAGVIVGLGSVAGHSHRLSDRLSPGYHGRLLVAQNLTAVTGACMVVRREAWEDVGGLDEENLAVAFNDVDFGLKLRQAGWRVVWTPYATLYHHESVTRDPMAAVTRTADFSREVAYMQNRWGKTLRTDPAYNPNLTADNEDFSLAWPPRVSYR